MGRVGTAGAPLASECSHFHRGQRIGQSCRVGIPLGRWPEIPTAPQRNRNTPPAKSCGRALWATSGAPLFPDLHRLKSSPPPLYLCPSLYFPPCPLPSA